jgi:hypothetical protein
MDSTYEEWPDLKLWARVQSANGILLLIMHSVFIGKIDRREPGSRWAVFDAILISCSRFL